MTIEIIWKKNPDGVHAVCTGHITGQELIKMNEELARYTEPYYQLIDFTAAQYIDYTPEDMHIIALQDKFISTEASLEKIAIVGPKAVLNNIGSIYEVYSKVWVGRTKQLESQTFHSIEEAKSWIGC
jgi:aspartate carbamoyltransferase regulatory subunit